MLRFRIWLKRLAWKERRHELAQFKLSAFSSIIDRVDELSFFLSSCWSTRDHIGRSTRNSNPVMTSSAGPVPRVVQITGSVHPPTYIAQLLTLHQHRTNNQYRTLANQIWPTLRVNSNTQATLEQSPIKVLTELNVAWLQWSYRIWYFQVAAPKSNSLIPKRSLKSSNDEFV